MNLLSLLGKKKMTTNLPEVIKPAPLEKTEADHGDITIVQRSGTSLSSRPLGGAVVHVRKKEVMVNGKKCLLDPQQLIRMIRQVTQTVGEYKKMNNVYSEYAINAMRKCRSDMVSDLESTFGIHFEIDESGHCQFWM